MPRLLFATITAILIMSACGDPSGITVSESSPKPAESTKEKTIKQYSAYPEMTIDVNKLYVAIITTNLGEITFELLPDEAPLAVNNFVFLARDGYYDGVLFHRVIPGFMAQSGDPTGLGTGGPGYTFDIETPQRPYLRGSLAMANRSAPNTNGSQFFIVFTDLTGRLNPGFSLFGQMTEGEESLAKIEAVPVGASAQGEQSKPLEEILITSIEIREK